MKRTLDAWNVVGRDEDDFHAAETTWPSSRSANVRMEFDLAAHAATLTALAEPVKESREINLWLPYPVSDSLQRITDVVLEGDFDSSGVYTEAEHGTTILHARWIFPNTKEGRKFFLTLTFKVTRQRIVRRDDYPVELPWNEADLAKYLIGTNLGPITGNVAKTAELITHGKATVLEKAEAVYRWVIENTYRDAGIIGCGDGDVCALLDKKLGEIGGKCTDLGSLFIAICRAAKVPCREVFGIRLGKTFGEVNISQWQHCWCEFFLPGFGWIPADPSDVRLKMLSENLPLIGSKKTDDYTRAFFGGIDSFRVRLSEGRDLVLEPPQQGKPLNTFGYPYCEVDGVALNHLAPDAFKYKFVSS